MANVKHAAYLEDDQGARKAEALYSSCNLRPGKHFSQNPASGIMVRGVRGRVRGVYVCVCVCVCVRACGWCVLDYTTTPYMYTSSSFDAQCGSHDADMTWPCPGWFGDRLGGRLMGNEGNPRQLARPVAPSGARE